MRDIFLDNQKKYDEDPYSFVKHKDIGNMMDYKLDAEINLYNKLCMIKIENADLLLTHIKSEHYISYLKIVLSEIYNYLDAKKFSEIIKSYMMDYSTFIIVCKPDVHEVVFLDMVQELNKKMRYFNPNNSNIPIIARFVIVLNQGSMLEIAITEMHSKRNAHKHFIICENSAEESSTTSHELEMILLLYWAIENNGVIPYYQGIYDTKKKCIDKYESLMRIVAEDGTVHLPNSFMEVAKKYHMYSQLSEMMIRRVIEDIEETNINVFINFSAFDINSVEFRTTIYELLKQRKSNSLLVFEILEDELFKDMEVLQTFVSEVSEFGVKIAIDDFGSGYSNLLEITQISPDYIKIDGEIIRNMNESYKNKAILELIVYLAKKIGVLTVAEHVESYDIFNHMKELEIDFLQGYYFSKPEPLSKLKLKIGDIDN